MWKPPLKNPGYAPDILVATSSAVGAEQIKVVSSAYYWSNSPLVILYSYFKNFNFINECASM